MRLTQALAVLVVLGGAIIEDQASESTAFPVTVEQNANTPRIDAALIK
jgi:hypothetical protein